MNVFLQLLMVLGVVTIIVFSFYPKVNSLKNLLLFSFLVALNEVLNHFISSFDQQHYLLSHLMRLFLLVGTWIVIIKMNPRIDWLIRFGKGLRLIQASWKWGVISFLVVPYSCIFFFVEPSPYFPQKMIVTIMVVPIIEEIFFRGILLSVAVNLFKFESLLINRLIGISMVSFLFALNHSFWVFENNFIYFDFEKFLLPIIPSIIWCVVTIKTKTIFWSVLSHSVSNIFILKIWGVI